MRAYILLVSAWSSTLILAAPAFADPPAPAPAASTPAASPPPPAKVSAAPSPYSPKLQKGHAAYLARDYPGAVAAYKEAVQADAADPFAYYFLGEAQLAAGNNADADASFTEGLSKAVAKDDIRAKLLFVIADLRERDGQWPEARKAWEDYGQFVTAHPGVKGYVATATERAKMIDVDVDLATKYGAVKQRIEQRLKETTAPPPDDGPQGPAKKK